MFLHTINYITNQSIKKGDFMKNVLYFSVLMAVLFLFPFEQISAQEEDLYEDGTVWSLTFVRTGANKSEDYLKGLANTWVASMEEAKKEGLILSYKILAGNAANEDDYDLILMIENKNMASFDPDDTRDAKFDAIEEKIKDKMGDEYEVTITNYDEIRNLMGTKLMREIYLKK
jgi:hypothetical protein